MPKKRNWIFMVVAPDEYELPFYWTDNEREIMEYCGYRDASVLWNRISLFRTGRLTGKKTGFKVVAVEV